ncbi:MAG: ribosomal protein S18-alanine N-acetyltransferase [Chloroflexota bacterium]|nr:ribosomal protein S18-alanine N-acetyltransferase [Chloroflexota bacterium]
MMLSLRYMRLTDVPQVVVIDSLSFDPPWSMRSYNFEVSESNYSHMVVLDRAVQPKPVPAWRRLLHNAPPVSDSEIVAYGGLWHIMDEAHISTIASHPNFRGQGFGEMALAGMIRRSITLRASFLVLEVRVSNAVAQKLYVKYGFKTVGIKRNYYHNDGEDAYEMHLKLEDNPTYLAQFEPRYVELAAKHEIVDSYTTGKPPRGG